MESNEVSEHEKMAILESIRAMVPDHDTRVQSLEVGVVMQDKICLKDSFQIARHIDLCTGF